MRRDSFDELTSAGELHGRNLTPAKTIFKLAGLELERGRDSPRLKPSWSSIASNAPPEAFAAEGAEARCRPTRLND
jgi:hypothetical protein